MLTKEKLAETLNRLPTEFTIDELVERLILIEKIEIGLAEVEAGDVISQDEVLQLIQDWSK